METQRKSFKNVLVKNYWPDVKLISMNGDMKLISMNGVEYRKHNYELAHDILILISSKGSEKPAHSCCLAESSSS